VVVATASRWSFLKEILLVAGFSLLIAVTARMAFVLPFTPVPVTGQTLAVLLAGAVLGSKRGCASVLLYLTWGAMGMPMFAGATAGAFWISATGGYLIGFAFAAFTVGYLTERGFGHGPRLLLALLLGNVVIYLFGLPWLAMFLAGEPRVWTNVIPGTDLFQKTLSAGLYPFVLGDLTKLFVAALALPSARRLAALYKR
jgi:biotin transport system substrate-specific component